MSDGLSFVLNEEQLAFKQSVRELVEDKIAPRAAEIDEADEYPWDVDELFVKHGVAGVSDPEEFGGAGGGAVEMCILVEEISRHSAGVALIPAVNKLGAIPILLAGTDDQKKKVCAGITNGDHRMSYCLTEPGSGSDAAAMRSRAVKDGNDWVLNGSKRFITGAGASDLYTYFAVTDPDAKKGRNITAFLLSSDMDGSRRRKEDKMGSAATDARGTEDAGSSDTYRRDQRRFPDRHAHDDSRVRRSAGPPARMRRAFDFAATRRERSSSGSRSRASGSNQFADMAMKIETARFAVYRAATAVDDEVPDVSYWAAIAKCYASDVAMSVTTDCVQALGGYGYVREYPVERYMRDAKITQIYEGTNQIQRVVIARSGSESADMTARAAFLPRQLRVEGGGGSGGSR